MQLKQNIILLVDDSPLVIDRLTEMLKPLENVKAILQADSYDNALKLLAESAPDIAILDINIPGKSGIDVLRYIKTHYAHIIVIMLTNQSNSYYQRLCQSLGADYFVDKSNEFERIPDIISSVS